MPYMYYISTRGGMVPIHFESAVMTGLARDGGLLIPESIPDVRDRMGEWRKLSYTELAFEVMRLFVDLSDYSLRRIIEGSYSEFRSREITPVVPVGDVHILELFHGPTLAFKDIALQFLGRLFEHILSTTGGELNIIAATSGDTGSAAIHGVKGRDRIRIFVMHPHLRISELQEKQMTSVLDPNVFNLAVQGTFDDCQGIMKSIFRDLSFRDTYTLGTVNSINWARVLAQMVYYFYAAFRVMDNTGAKRVRFSVPTGNFGDIFAGYMAARMGLPIAKLVLATNENDILARFFESGEYRTSTVKATISPSMDIQVASNFERYLYYRAGGKPAQVRDWMEQFARESRLVCPKLKNGPVDALIAGGVGTAAQTLSTIRSVYDRTGYLLDPHTAVGVSVAAAHHVPGEPMICLATAHPAKFGEAIKRALGQDIARHPILETLRDAPTRCEVVPSSEDAVRRFVADHIPR